MARLERIMDMINVLCLEDGRLNYGYIRSRYGISEREFRRDIEFLRSRLTDIGYLDKGATIEYVRGYRTGWYVYRGDKPALNQAFASSEIAEALSYAAENPLRVQFGQEERVKAGIRPVRYMYSAVEKVDYILFTALVSAIKECRKIHVDYVNSKGTETSQDLSPLQIINYSQIWYLKAESKWGTIITLSLSRIRKVDILDEEFERDEEKLRKSEGAYGIFSSARKAPVWYTMAFSSVAANIVSNQIWHKEQKAEWKDGKYILSVPAVSDVEIMGKMLSFLPDAMPLSPPVFVERFRFIINEASGRN